MVVEREFNGLLAMEDAQIRPPTVNDLASLLAHAMRRPPEYEIRQRRRKIYLRDRPQWQELLPHLRQLEIDLVLSSDLPWFDESAMDWTARAKTPPSPTEMQVILRQPFPEKETELVHGCSELDGMVRCHV